MLATSSSEAVDASDVTVDTADGEGVDAAVPGDVVSTSTEVSTSLLTRESAPDNGQTQGSFPQTGHTAA